MEPGGALLRGRNKRPDSRHKSDFMNGLRVSESNDRLNYQIIQAVYQLVSHQPIRSSTWNQTTTAPIVWKVRFDSAPFMRLRVNVNVFPTSRNPRSRPLAECVCVGLWSDLKGVEDDLSHQNTEVKTRFLLTETPEAEHSRRFKSPG